MKHDPGHASVFIARAFIWFSKFSRLLNECSLLGPFASSGNLAYKSFCNENDSCSVFILKVAERLIGPPWRPLGFGRGSGAIVLGLFCNMLAISA